MNTKRAGFEDGIKLAISAGLALSALQGRVARGARVAPGILSNMTHAASSGARATPAMGALVRNAGQDVRAATGMSRALANPTTQAMQGRVADAIKHEAGGAVTRTSSPLSSAYEGYMNTQGAHTYTPQHMGQVLGVNPNQIKLREGPTALMNPMPGGHRTPGAGGINSAAAGTKAHAMTSMVPGGPAVTDPTQLGLIGGRTNPQVPVFDPLIGHGRATLGSNDRTGVGRHRSL